MSRQPDDYDSRDHALFEMEKQLAAVTAERDEANRMLARCADTITELNRRLDAITAERDDAQPPTK